MTALLDRSWIATPDDVLAFITRLYDERAGGHYEEDVTQIAHAFQTAALAESAGAGEALVVAGLLHDIGHLVTPEDDFHLDHDLHHERIATTMLSAWFGPEVVQPVALHVAAKRYLVAVDPAYAAGLSPASVASLAVQGGPMSPTERAEFEQAPYFAEACSLRRWDDLAKESDADTPGWDHYGPIVRGQVAL